MSIADVVARREGGDLPRPRRGPAAWALWTQRASIVGYIALVEVTVVVSTVVVATRTTVHVRDLAMLAVIAVIGLLQAEIGRKTERVRRQVTETAHINLTSVWTFAGVLVMPPLLVGALATILYVQLSVRSWYRLREVTPYRAVMNTCFVIISCYLARAVLNRFGIEDIRAVIDQPVIGTVALIAAAVAYFLVGAVLVIPTVWARTHSTSDLIGTRSDNFLEAATLCLGAVLASVLVMLPVLAIAILPPLIILHRGVLTNQLETAATIDNKTGVLNAASWHYVANLELITRTHRPNEPLSVLMIDLDRFKLINDRHGHLIGDEVLKAAAACIVAEVREHDSVGRFGGEEFVVLLPRASEVEACRIAERIRQAITTLATIPVHTEGAPGLAAKLTVSIGVATHPAAGSTLGELTHAADTALYRAKNAGRNRVASTPSAA